MLSQVHKSILIRESWFEKALCGNFRESETEIIELPDEDPSIFHFVVAFLYERRYQPIRPIASVLSMIRNIWLGQLGRFH